MKHIKLFERYFDLNDPAAEQPTYQINYEFGKPKSITCLKCDMTSHNPNDIEHLYCGNCHEFHQPVEEDEEDYANLPSDMYYGKGPNLNEEPVSDDEYSNLPSDMYHGKGPSDKIDVTTIDVNNVVEKDHVITSEDNSFLNAYFAAIDGDDHSPFNMVGKTLYDAAGELGDRGTEFEYADEWLQHMLVALFPDKYNAE